jgi:sec-independent protein translocase protein TatA
MFGLGIQELLIILAIILVLFGGTKLPQLSKGIAQAIRELRKGFTDEVTDDYKKSKKSAKKEE